MAITALDHYALYVSEPERALDFYTRVLRLENGFRPPDLSFPGAWLYAGGMPIIHLMFLPPTPGLTGAVDHLAFFAEGDPDEMSERLEANGIEYKRRTLPRTGFTQIFFKGPDSVGLELNYKPQA